MARIEPSVWSRRAGSPTPPRGAVYVGRPTKWGNPYVLRDESQRAAVLADYERWIAGRPDLIAAARRELRGRHLVCWCAPLACHADVLLRLANEGGDHG